MRFHPRPSALLPLALALAFASPALAQQAAAGDPEVQSMVCDLSGDCGTGDDAATADAPAHKGARSSATRGFTFKRVAPDAAAGAALASSSAPKPAGAMPFATPRPARPFQTDLHLDFASASADLNPASRGRLSKLASALGNPRLATRRIRIEGHTDASGNPIANKTLSQRRAQAAADYLVSAGVARDRIEVMGYGSAQPLPNMPATAPQNRRVMATILN